MGCYAGTLLNTHANADQHHAELKDRFDNHTEWIASRVY